jgi:hypothetical protein
MSKVKMRPHRPHGSAPQFRKALAVRDGELDLDLDKEGRRQVLNASLNGIKLAVRSADRPLD